MEKLDSAIIEALPRDRKILAVERCGASSWASMARVDTEAADGSQKSYFLKILKALDGGERVLGEYLSMAEIHKKSCVRPNYVIKFHLCPGRITDPPVVRTLSCPADAPFYALHLSLQKAFGWEATHSFDFAVKDPDYVVPENPMLMMMQQTMNMNNSPGGRMGNDETMSREYMLRVVNPLDGDLAGIDQMHEGRRRHPRTVEKMANKWELWRLFEKAEYQGKQIIYTYDFGDNWEHHMTIEGRDDVKDFVCLSGTGHPVIENAGGASGWNEIKAAYRTSQPNQEQRERREWFEEHAVGCHHNGLDVDEWDMDAANREIKHLMHKYMNLLDVKPT